MRSRVLLAVAVLLVATVGVLLVWRDSGQVRLDAPEVQAPPGADFLIVGRAELAALPTTGPSWDAMKEVADGDLGEPNLEDQDNTNAARLLAAALVHARTGDAVYQQRVVDQLRTLPSQPLNDVRVLSLGRQLAGYVLAADLVGYRDPAFVGWVGSIRTFDLGGHARWAALTATSEDSGSNWGAWAMSSRIAASLYVGDAADVARAAQVFRGFLGDRAAYAGFRHTDEYDAGWACDEQTWTPVNPASCGFRSGAIVEDISRSDGRAPEVDPTGLTYSWETIGGAILSATLLQRAGYGDVWQWSDDALLRAAQFLQRTSAYPPRYSPNQHIPWVINRRYQVDYGPTNPAGFGREFGFTDWLP